MLIFDVRDKDHAMTEEIGVVELATQHLLAGHVVEDWFPIKKGSKENGHLHISVVYVSMVQIGEKCEVESYFPMHRGCHVTLYQDAHCPDNIPALNMVRGPHDRPNTPQSCWKDLYYYILGARNICCLTGWAIWTKLKLFRGEEALTIYGGTLGDLLVMKADEGVKVQVRLVLWSKGGTFLIS